MKVLFLDVDGVLNNYRCRGYNPLSKVNVRLLCEIVERTGCEIVLSSTWRKYEDSYHKIKNKLQFRKIEILDVTKIADFTGSCRGDEIQEWLDRHPDVENYVIADDDSDMLLDQLPHFVQTDPQYGLTETTAYRIIYKLNNGVRYLASRDIRSADEDHRRFYLPSWREAVNDPVSSAEDDTR